MEEKYANQFQKSCIPTRGHFPFNLEEVGVLLPPMQFQVVCVVLLINTLSLVGKDARK